MERKRHTTEEIIRKLREAEVLEDQSSRIEKVCEQLEISAQKALRYVPTPIP